MNITLLAAGAALLSLPLQWFAVLLTKGRLNIWIAILAAVVVFAGLWLVLYSLEVEG